MRAGRKVRPTRKAAMIYNVSTEMIYFGGYALLIAFAAGTVFFSLRLLRKRGLLLRALSGGLKPEEEDSLDIIRRHARRETYRAGTVLFCKGDVPDRLYVIGSGTIRLPEAGIRLRRDEILGELGVFTPEARRTLSAVCESDCVVHTMPYETMVEVLRKHPKVSFHLMRLIVRRMIENGRPSHPPEDLAPA